ncbi:MAG: hypothetical protein Ct9H300mP25_11920 [Acidobacteriota bacterium]|nr:MAG: hypothetical protein Ct9H300mP25_11920 [Acidobacteriota bacterium]
MKRALVLTVLCAFSLVAVMAQDTPKVIEVEQLEDNLFVLRGEGGGGNTAVFVTTDGVVVVDTKNPDWGKADFGADSPIDQKPPVTTLVNTHSHGDHVSGMWPLQVRSNLWHMK